MNTFQVGEQVVHKDYNDRFFVIKEIGERSVRADELLLVGSFTEDVEGEHIQKWKLASDCRYGPCINLDFCQRPPLGLIKRRVRDEQRIDEIAAAINRYTKERKEIPMDWIDEYNEIAYRLTDHGDQMY